MLGLKPPTARIGLGGDGRSLSLDSAGGFYIVDRDTGRDIWKHLHQGPVRIVRERGAAPEPAEVFRVQVASLASQQEAEALKARLESETGEAVQVTRNPDRNAWRVRVGQRASREEIRQVEDRLREIGFNEIWVVQEGAPGGAAPKLRLVDQDYNDMLTSSRALLVLPAAEGRPLKVGDQPYRGVLEILLTRSRELQAVNVLNVEDYLKGVVPKELGPTLYAELEALKAQAVAARTYLEANRGQFAEDGFDICDSARCQVYGGLSAEHPLSDFAVEQTAGLIATFEGKPINALYTATCGGHTEDLKNVFREMEGPYLRGVECYADEASLVSGRRTLAGAWTGPPVTLRTGERIDDAIAMLEVLGVMTADQSRADYLAGFPTASDVGAWMSRTLKAAGKKPPAGFEPARELHNVAELAEYLVEGFGWGERLKLLIDPRDLPAFLGEAPLASTPERARIALACLVKDEILPRPRPATGSMAADPVSRASLARALHRMILHYEATGLVPAKYRGSRAGAMAMQSEGTLTVYPLASRLHLILRTDGDSQPLSEYVLQEGDNVEYHLAGDGSIDLLAIKANQRSATDDRFTNVYVWEVRMSRQDLETRIRSRASIGRLVDLVPGRRGASGRLIDLAVFGSSGKFTFQGFNIERLLGLRETLFVVDRQYDADGRVGTFVFSGKGWGHGVGMCQVGAYGMALRGKSYEEILHHYYTGISLQKTGSR